MQFIEISNIFKSEKKRYKVTAVLKLLVVFALLGFFYQISQCIMCRLIFT